MVGDPNGWRAKVRNNTTCPKCKAVPGEMCRYDSPHPNTGARTRAHIERHDLYLEQEAERIWGNGGERNG